jgi:3',5'-cyclic AMP phosphodiesterase CpdA
VARLLHLSDLHVVAPGTLASGILDTTDLLGAAIDTILGRLDAIGPIDAVLVTGDISDDGTAESYATALSDLLRLGLPLLVIPGNHDHRETFRKAFAEVSHLPQKGPLNWVADVGDARIVGLDTLIQGQGSGRLDLETLEFLSSALEGASGRSVVVALHHPPIKTGIRFMDAIGLANPEELERIASRFGGHLRFLAGHVHGVFHGMLGPHPVSTAPSICSAFAFDGRAEAPVGFMSGPLGFAFLDTGARGVWCECPLKYGDGPFRFSNE